MQGNDGKIAKLRRWLIEQNDNNALRQERRADKMAMKRGRGKRRAVRAQMRADSLRRQNDRLRNDG